MPLLPPSRLRFVLAATAMVLFAGCAADQIRRDQRSGIIPPDDPNIRYLGRVDVTNPLRPRYDWAGVAIMARFEGTRCAVRLDDPKDEYAVIIDQHAPRILTPDTAQLCVVAEGLADSVPHTILLQKRTEPLVGHGEFLGFVLDPGRGLLPLPPRPERRIEFIGNSITSGYGDEGASAGCHFSPQTENAAMSYAAQTARSLQADYMLISYSGRGVVRNYGDSLQASRDPMPALYPRTCFFDSTRFWDFRRWVPQAVVINLGTNDFSTHPYPDSAVFHQAYDRLIERVRFQYPGVTMFCVSGPMIGEPCTHYVRCIVDAQQQRRGREKDVFFVEIPEARLDASDWGCDRHPNVTGMQKMAEILSAAIRLRMSW